jgi:hypothetical protein
MRLPLRRRQQRLEELGGSLAIRRLWTDLVTGRWQPAW